MPGDARVAHDVIVSAVPAMSRGEIGAVTTAGTFYSFLVTDFRGLWELGLLTGTYGGPDWHSRGI